MVKDVLDNHLKPGMHYQEVKNLLGNIHASVTNDCIGNIVLMYGFDNEFSGIDYQNSYWLEIIFSPDSLLTTAAYKELNNTKPIYQIRDQGN